VVRQLSAQKRPKTGLFPQQRARELYVKHACANASVQSSVDTTAIQVTQPVSARLVLPDMWFGGNSTSDVTFGFASSKLRHRTLKETDRRWEQGEDPSMIDSDIFIYEKRTKLVIADSSERKKFATIGWRRIARESKLSLAPVGKVIKGEGVRPQTLSIIRQTAARVLAE
jgi:hypothetical protein